MMHLPGPKSHACSTLAGGRTGPEKEVVPACVNTRDPATNPGRLMTMRDVTAADDAAHDEGRRTR